MKATDMLKGNPGKSLFFFAIPMILGNLFQQFYNMADSIIVGRYVGEDALAAIGASYSLTTVFIMIAIGGGIGSSVLTSQFLGAGRYGKMKSSIYTTLFAFLAVSIVLGIIGVVGNRWILTLLKTPDNIMEDAMLYLNIYFLGLPFLFMYNIMSSVFNALGKSKIPLYLLIFSSVLNVALDLYMVRVLGWGVAGAAIATLIAQGISAVAAFWILIRKLKEFTVLEEEKVALFDQEILLHSTKIAIPSIIQQSIVSIGLLLVQSVVNSFGSSVLAGYSAGMRVESICIVPMIAMGNAVSTFTAQNVGANQIKRVKKGYWTSYGMIFCFAVIICVVLNLFHSPILSAFLDGDKGMLALETGSHYLTFISWFFVFIGLKSVTDGVLRGAGDVKVYMIANLINLGLRVVVANYFAPIWGVQAVWFAVPIGWVVNYAISFIWFSTGHWHKKKILVQ